MTDCKDCRHREEYASTCRDCRDDNLYTYYDWKKDVEKLPRYGY